MGAKARGKIVPKAGRCRVQGVEDVHPADRKLQGKHSGKTGPVSAELRRQRIQLQPCRFLEDPRGPAV